MRENSLTEIQNSSLFERLPHEGPYLVRLKGTNYYFNFFVSRWYHRIDLDRFGDPHYVLVPFTQVFKDIPNELAFELLFMLDLLK